MAWSVKFEDRLILLVGPLPLAARANPRFVEMPALLRTAPRQKRRLLRTRLRRSGLFVAGPVFQCSLAVHLHLSLLG